MYEKILFNSGLIPLYFGENMLEIIDSKIFCENQDEEIRKNSKLALSSNKLLSFIDYSTKLEGFFEKISILG